MRQTKRIVVGALCLAVLAAVTTCSVLNRQGKNLEDEVEIAPAGPAFNADSALAFCAAQCAFGPRVMNSDAHDRCGEYIARTFERFGCTVIRQQADLKGWDGKTLHSTNIIASRKAKTEGKHPRVMLCAHWDSRPWADNDADSANWYKPVMGANDGASGIGVMLEIARLIRDNDTLGVDVDFVCFDAEDYGVPRWSDVNDEDSWALGAQYFAGHLPEGFQADYGILLDMVGGQGAKFYQEGLSKQYAPNVMRRVWYAARQAGYGSEFPSLDGGMITDDHLPLNRDAQIPVIDIIPYYPDCPQGSFGPTWHTVYDDMEHLSISSLKAVGQTVIQVLFTE